MQGYNVPMDGKLVENISAMLQLYAKSFENIEALNKPEMALGISFGKNSLGFIVKKLYEK